MTKDKLYLVIYKEDNKIECITNNFKLWLKEHNKNRKLDNNNKEQAYEFNIKEIEYKNF